ncbi:hypothetical protein [Nocardia gipuzkoensis]
MNYAIIPVETVSRGVKPGGGKKKVLELFRQTRHSGGLQHKSRGHTAAVMFCVDSDHDRVTRSTLRSRHLTYTSLPDIEAHLFDDFDLIAAVCQAHSATDTHKTHIAEHFRKWREGISSAWREWFVLCLAAHYSGVRDPSPGTPPQTAANSCELVPARLSDVRDKIVKTVGIAMYERNRVLAEERIDSLFKSKSGIQLLKGKWLAPQLHGICNTFADSHGLPKAKSADVTLEAVKGHAKFSSRTTRYYHKRFETLLV